MTDLPQATPSIQTARRPPHLGVQVLALTAGLLVVLALNGCG